jgi:hypothetical protein
MERKLWTIDDFADKQLSWPSKGTLRNLANKSLKKDNDFRTAFKRVGRRILVDEVEFWECVERINERNMKSRE